MEYFHQTFNVSKNSPIFPSSKEAFRTGRYDRRLIATPSSLKSSRVSLVAFAELCLAASCMRIVFSASPNFGNARFSFVAFFTFIASLKALGSSAVLNADMILRSPQSLTLPSSVLLQNASRASLRSVMCASLLASRGIRLAAFVRILVNRKQADYLRSVLVHPSEHTSSSKVEDTSRGSNALTRSLTIQQRRNQSSRLACSFSETHEKRRRSNVCNGRNSFLHSISIEDDQLGFQTPKNILYGI
mmetsp:Transcript_43704/g.171027  ORF Transcript_43704/g.171027 Transcript_43704/m.171027 type:complete len:245 (-) Transcript_43704:215-949(-)